MIIIKTKFCPLCNNRLRRIYTKDYFKLNGKNKAFWNELGWYCSKCNYSLIDRFGDKLGYQHTIDPYSLLELDKTPKEILNKILDKIRIS